MGSSFGLGKFAQEKREVSSEAGQMIKELLEKDHESLSVLLSDFKQKLIVRDLRGAHDALDLFWARLAMHIRAEHLCLFPAIENAQTELFGRDVPAVKDVHETIEQLREDHSFFMERLAHAMQIVRAIFEGEALLKQLDEVESIVAAVEARLEQHNEVEEREVYRWPVALLTESELSKLETDSQKQLENLPPRFQPRMNADEKD